MTGQGPVDLYAHLRKAPEPGVPRDRRTGRWVLTVLVLLFAIGFGLSLL